MRQGKGSTSLASVESLIEHVLRIVDSGGLLQYDKGALITNAEALLYSGLASFYSHEGLIVDAGSFIGCSTRALCQGLNKSNDFKFKPILAIDRFTVRSEYLRRSLLDMGVDVKRGESFIDVFLDHVREHLTWVEVRAGDVQLVGRIDRTIELCVVDISKSEEINSYIVKNWLPRMAVKKGILVQQDFFSPFHPWIALSMAPLLDCFSLLPYRIGEAAVFVCERTPMDSEIAAATSPCSSFSDAVARLDRFRTLLLDVDYKYLELAAVLLQSREASPDGCFRSLEALKHRELTPRDFKWARLLSLTDRQLERTRMHAAPNGFPLTTLNPLANEYTV